MVLRQSRYWLPGYACVSRKEEVVKGDYSKRSAVVILQEWRSRGRKKDGCTCSTGIWEVDDSGGSAWFLPSLSPHAPQRIGRDTRERRRRTPIFPMSPLRQRVSRQSGIETVCQAERGLPRASGKTPTQLRVSAWASKCCASRSRAVTSSCTADAASKAVDL